MKLSRHYLRIIFIYLGRLSNFDIIKPYFELWMACTVENIGVFYGTIRR